jgi:hypothetical protein
MREALGPLRERLVMFDARDALAVALRLAFGRPGPEDARADWPLVFDAASRELLAPLAWSRSGLFIRRHADAAITAPPSRHTCVGGTSWSSRVTRPRRSMRSESTPSC